MVPRARVLLAAMVVLGFGTAAARPVHAQGLLAEMMFKPPHGFSGDSAPPEPDYASSKAWAALPDSGETGAAQPADARTADRVDVFFMHPTTFLSPAGWNAAFDDPGRGVGGGGVDATLRNQASVFSACCRIFAPRYRQATLYAFIDPGSDGGQAIDLAYGDVQRAFDQFIARRSGGRPFVLAGHSQGSIHALRLIQQRIAGTPLERRLVAAFVIGAAVPHDFRAIPICGDARQTGCVISWNAVSDAADRSRAATAPVWRDGRYQRGAAWPWLCVNPLDWRVDGDAPATAHLGALPSAAQPPGDRPVLKTAYVAAKCIEGQLVVDLPADRTDFRVRFGAPGSLHIYDYNLFYGDLRANVALRIAAYLARR